MEQPPSGIDKVYRARTEEQSVCFTGNVVNQDRGMSSNMSPASELSLQNILDAITARLQSGDDIEPLLTQPAASQEELEDYAGLIQSLQTALTPLEPRAEFAEALRADLIESQRGMVLRMRQMPAQVHIMAMLALIAGFLLLMWRRLVGSDTPQDIAEEAIATPL